MMVPPKLGGVTMPSDRSALIRWRHAYQLRGCPLCVKHMTGMALPPAAPPRADREPYCELIAAEKR